jgi:hypothetical protein
VSLQRCAKVVHNEERKNMKRILLALLGLVIVLGLFGVVGYTGYRLGYTQGTRATANDEVPRLRPFDEFNPRGMPRPNFQFERRFERGFGPGRFSMMGFGFFFALRWIAPLALLTLIALFVYWLVTRSGWRLTRQTTDNVPPPPKNE